jgi:hypothetical protein
MLKMPLLNGSSNAQVLCLVDADNFDCAKIKSNFQTFFGEIFKPDYVCFSKGKILKSESSKDFFTTKDFSILGSISNHELLELIQQEYEYVFHFFSEEHLFLNFISLKSKATLRLGNQNSNLELTDLIFNIDKKDLDLFFMEAKKYLTIIKNSA